MATSFLMGNKNLRNFSPSVKEIFRLIKRNERINTTDLRLQTKYSQRTVRYALRQLRDAQLVTRIPDISDTRRYYYIIQPSPPK
jgi:DNA-binding MarR family transcriptional regulator